MLDLLRKLVEVLLRVFALGLLVSILLNWIGAPRLKWVQDKLNRFYDFFLNPIRRYVKPIRLSPSAPVGLDLTPLILLLLIWWLVYPLSLWILGGGTK